MIFNLEIVTPERVVLKTAVSSVTVPTQNGEITILPHHLPLVSILQPGVIEARLADATNPIAIMAVSGGFIEVLKDKVIILADTAEHAAELDEARILQAQEQAKQLKIEAADQVDFAAVNAKIAKELARASARERWKKLYPRGDGGFNSKSKQNY